MFQSQVVNANPAALNAQPLNLEILGAIDRAFEGQARIIKALVSEQLSSQYETLLARNLNKLGNRSSLTLSRHAAIVSYRFAELIATEISYLRACEIYKQSERFNKLLVVTDKQINTLNRCARPDAVIYSCSNDQLILHRLVEVKTGSGRFSSKQAHRFYQQLRQNGVRFPDDQQEIKYYKPDLIRIRFDGKVVKLSKISFEQFVQAYDVYKTTRSSLSNHYELPFSYEALLTFGAELVSGYLGKKVRPTGSVPRPTGRIPIMNAPARNIMVSLIKEEDEPPNINYGTDDPVVINVLSTGRFPYINDPDLSQDIKIVNSLLEAGSACIAYSIALSELAKDFNLSDFNLQNLKNLISARPRVLEKLIEQFSAASDDYYIRGEEVSTYFSHFNQVDQMLVRRVFESLPWYGSDTQVQSNLSLFISGKRPIPCPRNFSEYLLKAAAVGDKDILERALIHFGSDKGLLLNLLAFHDFNALWNSLAPESSIEINSEDRLEIEAMLLLTSRASNRSKGSGGMPSFRGSEQKPCSWGYEVQTVSSEASTCTKPQSLFSRLARRSFLSRFYK